MTGLCECHPPFTGAACERMACAGTLNRSHVGTQDIPYVDSGGGAVLGQECGGHGVCRTMGEAAQLVDDVSLFRSVQYTLWDHDKVQGCVCDRGWTGYDCSQRSCPSGDDPFTVGTNGVQKVDCQCTALDCSGSFTISFRGSPVGVVQASAKASDFAAALNSLEQLRGVSVAFYTDDAADADADGLLVESDLTDSDLCNHDGVFALVEFLYDHGSSVPLLRIGVNSVSEDASTSNVTVTQYTASTKEDAPCNNHGRCSPIDGSCECDALFFSSDGAGGYASFTDDDALNEGITGDCGYTDTFGLDEAAFALDYNCPSANQWTCSGRGRCRRATMQCLCYDGFQGHDCNERVCPFGAAWFDEASADDTAHASAECSNRGVCNRVTGMCMCQHGFSGGSCNRLDCPAGDASGNNVCAGNGQCLSMRELAEARRDGEGLSAPLEYGSAFDSAAAFAFADAWDAAHVFGCACDHQHNSLFNDGEHIATGFDCSQSRCPTGPTSADIDAVIGGARAVQSVSCELASPASFQLIFREAATEWLDADATVAEVETALEALATVGLVSVSGAGGCNVTVTFETELENVPLLQANVDGADADSDGTQDLAVTVTVVQSGTRTAVECSGNGICNVDTGLCECFDGYAASDGDGNLGVRDDCGYYIPER